MQPFYSINTTISLGLFSSKLIILASLRCVIDDFFFGSAKSLGIFQVTKDFKFSLSFSSGILESPRGRSERCLTGDFFFLNPLDMALLLLLLSPPQPHTRTHPAVSWSRKLTTREIASVTEAKGMHASRWSSGSLAGSLGAWLVTLLLASSANWQD